MNIFFTHELPCGSSRLLLQSIPLKIMSFVHQLLNWEKNHQLVCFLLTLKKKKKSPFVFALFFLGFLSLIVAFVLSCYGRMNNCYLLNNDNDMTLLTTITWCNVIYLHVNLSRVWQMFKH